MATDQEFLQGQAPGVGGGAGAPGGVAQPGDPSTAGDGEHGQPRINLTDLPEFRQWQSSQDQKMAAMQRRLADAETAKEKEALAGMDNYERAQYEAEKNARRAKDLEDQLINIQAESYRQQRLTDLSTKYGVPLDALDASSPEAALQSALDYVATGKPRRGTPSGATPPRVDVGGGAPKGNAERIREKYRDAKRTFDSTAMLRHAAEAEAAGISLD